MQLSTAIVITPRPGRVKEVALTSRGKRAIVRALPQWAAAQDAFLQQFERAAWNTIAAQLVAMVGIARRMADEEG